MNKKHNRDLARLFSLASGLVCILLITFLAKGQQYQEGCTLGDFSAVSISNAEADYAKTPSTQRLVYLLQVLCYYAVEENNQEAQEKVALYGTELYNLAREGEVDLSTLGDEEETLELLGWIKEFGGR